MRILAGALAVVVLVGLAGCGFTPLYAQPGVTPALAGVQITAPEGRTGYLLREQLEEQLSYSASAAPTYRMALQLAEERYPRGVRIDNVATRYEYVLTTYYVLTSAASGAEVKRGQVRIQLTYDSADQPYASIAAQQEAQERAADQAARRIQVELAAWLAAGARS